MKNEPCQKNCAPKKLSQTVENKEWHLAKMIVSRKTRAKQLKIKNGTLPKRPRTKIPSQTVEDKPKETMAFEKNDRAPKNVPNS